MSQLRPQEKGAREGHGWASIPTSRAVVLGIHRFILGDALLDIIMKRSREPEAPPTPSTLGTHDSDSEDFEETLLPTAKVIELEASAEDDQGAAMKCFLPPHREPQSFRTYAEYETHYHSTHTNRCVECGKNFPSAHLLDVHIEECHDSFAAVKRERGEQTVSLYIDILIAQSSWSTNAGRTDDSSIF